MTEPTPPIWLTEDDVRAHVTLNDAIAALGTDLPLEARAAAANLDKALGSWNDGKSSMHALGSMMPARGYAGFKTWANTPGGAAAVLSLFDAANGRLLAMMEAGSLGQMRTSGVSGLATRLLAAPEADEMALVGTGVQAMMQIAAVAATRPLRRVRIFSRAPDKRAAFVARARALFAFDVVDCDSLDAAVSDAPIITLITRATEPFLSAAMIAKGAHINAAGAILPGNAELAQDVFDRAGLVVVDSIANARKGSAELRARFGESADGWTGVKTLGAALAEAGGRPARTDISVFKPMGMGLSDLSVAALVYERATAAGSGVPLPRGTRQPPRFTAMTTDRSDRRMFA